MAGASLPPEEQCGDGPRDREPQQQHEQVLETLESGLRSIKPATAAL